MNSTIVVDFEPKSDDFSEVYNYPILNVAMLCMYLLGLFGCGGLGFVSWFERSGNAGPFRTVINQLTSTIIDQIILMYVFGFGVDNVRTVVGPLPTGLCSVAAFFKIFGFINIILLILSINIIKFIIASVYKAMPIMEDNLISLIVYGNVIVISNVLTIMKLVIEVPPPRYFMAVCTGDGSISKGGETRRTHLFLVLVVLNALVHIPIALYQWHKRRSNSDVPQPHNHQFQPKTNLGGILQISYIIVFCAGYFWISGSFVVNEPEYFNKFPGLFYIHAIYSFMPSLFVVSLVVLFFATKKYIRKALRNMIVPNSIHIVTE